MQTLDVVNACLGTMGHVPLASLAEPHAFKNAATSTLDRLNREVQSKGWWFNRETLVLHPDAYSAVIDMPGDAISVRVPRSYTSANRNLVWRGGRLYDTDRGTNQFTEDVTVEIIRLVQFEDLPEEAAQHIAAKTILQFQSAYDGDTAKSRELGSRINGPDGTLVALKASETRNVKANFLEANEQLQTLKNLTRRVRSPSSSRGF
jgi:hypothetical protein